MSKEDKTYKELFTALKDFQSEMPVIEKNKEVNVGKYGYKYADLASITEAIKPVLAKHGLSYMQMLTTMSGEPALKTIIAHESGEYMYETTKIPVKAGSDAQKHGSAITYFKRYALSAALGIVTDEDVDANDIKGMTPQQKHKIWQLAKENLSEENEGRVPGNAEVISYLQEMTGKVPSDLYYDDAQSLIKMLED